MDYTQSRSAAKHFRKIWWIVFVHFKIIHLKRKFFSFKENWNQIYTYSCVCVRPFKQLQNISQWRFALPCLALVWFALPANRINNETFLQSSALSTGSIKVNEIYLYHDKNKLLNVLFLASLSHLRLPFTTHFEPHWAGYCCGRYFSRCMYLCVPNYQIVPHLHCCHINKRQPESQQKKKT